MKPDEALLQELLRTRDECLERISAASRAGVTRARVHAIENELTDTIESIQTLCVRRGLPLPEGIPPMRPWEVDGIARAQRILSRQLRLLNLRHKVLDAAVKTGNRAGAYHMRQAIRADRQAIRKHCEAAKLPLPPEVSDPD